MSQVIPTGSIQLDKALGVGGLPKGSIVLLSGPAGSGKTTLALHAMAECQRQGGVVAYIDTDYAFDAGYAKNLGVNLNFMAGIRPVNAEEALRHVEELVGTGDVSLLVVDSVDALAEPEDGKALELDQLNRLLSTSLRKLVGLAARTKTCVLLLSQSRRDGEAKVGGNALGYCTGVHIGISQVELLGKGGDMRISVVVSKNSMAPSPCGIKLDILYGRGISLAGEVFDVAEERGLITRTDSGLMCNGVLLGQDRETARDSLEEFLKGVSDLRDFLIGLACKAPPNV